MTLTLRVLATFAWGLWLGGMVALVLFVTRLFGTSRQTGLASAPVLFDTFAWYQIALGAVAVLATALWCARARSRLLLLSAALMTLALALALPIRSATKEMDLLRESGQSQDPRFQSLHRTSERLYGASGLALILAGIGLAAAPRPRRRDDVPQSPA